MRALSTLQQLVMTRRHFKCRFSNKRFLSVKELPWCAPTDSPVRRKVRLRRRDGARTHEEEHKEEVTLEPIAKFGIVGAVAQNSRVIGVDGKLPWRQALDRQIFKHLTRDGILIVGRKTLQDELNLSLGHVRHAKHCIVLSTTVSSVDELLQRGNLQDDNNETKQRGRNWEMLRLAGSLEEALHIANRLNAEMENDHDTESGSTEESQSPTLSSPYNSDLTCWVAGGERLFEEALKHPSAKELHLSTVNVEIDIANIPIENVAKFPAKYRWDNNYKCVYTKDSKQDDDELQPNEPTFSYQVFERIERNKRQ